MDFIKIKESWDDLSDQQKDSIHAELRVLVLREDSEKIIHLVNNLPNLLNLFNGLAMRVAYYHGKQKSIDVLTELGSILPKKDWVSF